MRKMIMKNENLVSFGFKIHRCFGFGCFMIDLLLQTVAITNCSCRLHGVYWNECNMFILTRYKIWKNNKQSKNFQNVELRILFLIQMIKISISQVLLIWRNSFYLYQNFKTNFIYVYYMCSQLHNQYSLNEMTSE